MRTLTIAMLFALTLPAAARTIVLTWLHSGKPAASLEVRCDDLAPLLADANGGVTIPAVAKTITIRDPKSGLDLLQRAVGDESSIAVPEPIRITGFVSRSRGRVTARVGDGPRGSALKRYQNDVGTQLEKRGAHPALPFPLPDSPLRWTRASMSGRGFRSAWIVADPAPQLVVFDERGHSAFRELAIAANVQPHAEVKAGIIPLEPGSTLDVTVVPPNDASASLELHVTQASSTTGKAAARELAVLDQLDRRLFALLALGEPYYLPRDGRARLQFPGWLSTARVIVRESFEGGSIVRALQLRPGDRAKLSASFDDLFAKIDAQPINGTVVSGDPARPVAGAAVVLADRTRRRETTTDIAGHFHFDDVRTTLPVSLFVDARNGGARTHHRTAAFRVKPEANLSLQLPPRDTSAPPALGAPPFPNCDVGDDQYPIALTVSSPAGAAYAIDVDWSTLTMIVSSDIPGTFVFDVYATPFFLFHAQVVVESSRPGVGKLTYIEPQDVTLNLRSHDGRNLPTGLELSFSPPPGLAEWLDATELDLDSSSSRKLPCVNVNPLALYVDDENAGGCDGILTLTGTTCTIFLPNDPLQPCVCR